MADYVVVDKEQLEADLTTVADAIREKGGTTETFAFPQGMADAVNALPDAESGGENPLYYASQMRNLFWGATFPEGYTIILNFPNLSGDSSAFQMFNTSNIYKVIISGNNGGIPINMSYMFNACSQLEEVDFSGFNLVANNIGYMVSACKTLRRVIGEFDLSYATSATGAFVGCSVLEEIRFKENTIKINFSISNSPLLSAESIQSIIDGLADLTGLETQTLTLHAGVKTKLTEEQITTITSKNWTLA